MADPVDMDEARIKYEKCLQKETEVNCLRDLYDSEVFFTWSSTIPDTDSVWINDSG